ncbi:alkaline phosphatase family protein [Acanthopleuribacter pedis]|uniref:Alkaline phosphatase family protein n=1 Tax=Acanthopleuribacter pedis TaxID=442870 RepID=A0A8J7QGN5_9BACT|nr:alkaline phosphatase family protein [Acanthopleuribacter pedis]MBO1319775.1 alkaline phosphatase family protein [Acanthopleuribacter pedis]
MTFPAITASLSRTAPLLLLSVLCLGAFATVAPLHATERTQKKVVVLGFDGADDKLVRQMMDEGQLPNMVKLKEMGGYAALTPTNPPQTPVSWSTFATGLNPGRTGIFDFLRRQDGTYIPDFALRGETRTQVLFGELNPVALPALAEGVVFALVFILLSVASRLSVLKRVLFSLAASLPAAGAAFFVANQWLPDEIPAVVTVRKGKPIWKMLEENGKTAKIIRLPVTFPAEPLNGEMIAGLAVPDIRGTIGRPSIFTNDPDFETGENQFSVIVNRFDPGVGPFETEIMGPPNKLFYDANAAKLAKRSGQEYPHPKDFALPMTVGIEGDKLVIQVGGETLRIGHKEWSDTVIFEFRVNPLISLKGFGRFYVDTLSADRFKVYLTAVNLHPDSPLPLSYPADFSAKLWQKEPFKTQGWALDTWSIGGALMDEDHFMEDVDLTVTRFETMMDEFLDQNDRDLFVQVFSFTDRVAHILWRYWDEGHPLYDAEKGPKYQEVMRETYRRMDRIVGRAMEKIDFNTTTLIVCSDHGFASFRYQFHFNTWLYENGYLKLKQNVLGTTMKLDDLLNAQTPFNYVDWGNTKAYALGLGMIFINLEGREPEGSVKQEEYDALCRELVTKLEAYTEPETGMKPVRKVFLRDEMYKGYNPGETPDLRVATAPDWRVSWDTTLGGLPNKITEINPKNWSGDHCSLAPEDVQGIFFSSLPFKNQTPKMADMCPSMLDLLEVKTDIDMDGETVY